MACHEPYTISTARRTSQQRHIESPKCPPTGPAVDRLVTPPNPAYPVTASRHRGAHATPPGQPSLETRASL